MKYLLALFLTISGTAVMAQNNPVASNAAIVEWGNARFTLLTPQMIRMEYHPLRHFENKASQVVLNRNLPVPSFKTVKTGNEMTISTAALVLHFINDGQPFSPKNLRITFLHNDYQPWYPYLKDSLNLKGTTRTLDNWNGGSPDKLEDGLVSRSGWALIDDSRSLVFNNSHWIEPRPDNAGTDWYFLGYGNQYKKALQDYTAIAGKMTMPPQFVFGYWWSKYWVYSDGEIRNLVQDLQSREIPVDVMILDMDWHDVYGLNFTNPRKDAFGEPVGWTGYTWNKALFPQPDKYLQWTKIQQLKTAVNIHPASGITPMEPFYNAFAKRTGFDTAGHHNIPFELETKKFADTYNELVLQPLKKQGVNFFWLDWQQWLEAKKMPGLSNTWWLNHWFYNFTAEKNERPLIFHRWGGLGNHRYPIGFSGDAFVNWKTLAFEPYFTATAANVGYGYWSHDIGGHNPNGMPTNAELYLRWIQFGAFSPVLRTHATKSKIMERRIWQFPKHYEAMKAAIKLRYRLFPYIYTAARQGYDSALTICRPLYVEHPADSAAYRHPDEYYFGSNIIAAPVVAAVDPKNGLSQKNIWLPAGNWFEACSGTLLQGGKEYIRQYAIDEIPYFIKAGTPLPGLTQQVKNLQSASDTLVLSITPGGNGSFDLYEDDGSSTGYLQNQFARTTFTATYIDNKKALNISISAAKGTYANKKKARYFQVELPNTLLPATVKVDNISYPFAAVAANGKYAYNAVTLTLQINTPLLATGTAHQVSIQWNDATDYALLNGVAGKFKRLNEAVEILKTAAQGDFFLPDSLYALQQTALRIQYDPRSAAAELAAFNKAFDRLAPALNTLILNDTAVRQYAITHLPFEVPDAVLAQQAARRIQLGHFAEQVTLPYPYSPVYTGGGKAGLFDGIYADLHYLDEAWQGYEGSDVEVIIDRQADTASLKEITLNCLQDDKNYIFLPRSVKVYASNDAVHYAELGAAYNEPILINNSNFIKKFRVNANGSKARYIKIVADAVKICPPGHRGAGDKAWTFVDELELIKN
ncbi:MAG: glycoside hydrolase family 31 protein [Ferruginibacter sp.]